MSNEEKIERLQLQMNTIFAELNVIESEVKDINRQMQEYDDEVKRTGNFEPFRIEWEILQWDRWNNDQLKIRKLETVVAISTEIDNLKKE